MTPQNEGPAPKFHHFTGRLPPDSRFCQRCGNDLRQDWYCTKCGQESAYDAVYCGNCGNPRDNGGTVGASPGIGAVAMASSLETRGGGTARTSPVSLVGGALILLSGVLPWVSVEGLDALGYQVPLRFLVDYDATGSRVSLGLLLAIVGILVFVSSMMATKTPRRILGAFVLAGGAAFTFQLWSYLDSLGIGGFTPVYLGSGFYVAVGAGALTLFAQRQAR